MEAARGCLENSPMIVWESKSGKTVRMYMYRKCPVCGVLCNYVRPDNSKNCRMFYCVNKHHFCFLCLRADGKDRERTDCAKVTYFEPCPYSLAGIQQ